MARTDLAQRMEALRGTQAGMIFAEALKDELEAKQKQFMSCTKETFETHRGRCLELQDLINKFEGRNKT